MNSRRMIVPSKKVGEMGTGRPVTPLRLSADRPRDFSALGALASDRADVGTAPVRLLTLIPVKLGD